MEQKFCPYPGLRPFNEEESIFFKGRDTQVSKVVSLLEKNKFLMITGASGDGKSSLTYAGLIPNARAGFFKAKFNNWRIADFRPERTPLENLSQTLSKALQIPLTEVEQSVKAGFSSLVNLYKKSKWHVDYLSDEWLLADETKKRSIKRQGANVLILVDQFEEFFTNQENFTNGIPSVESQLVMNVLLETAKIAHSQDLPIYVVCTMRSDYIGQCAAFRGLPEMIGFSQFFVPRLKRKEIQQVITEPAKLAGCQITSRLSETLINELGSGFDQLPVLQHALNQLWQLSYGATGNGKEMDLLSLAKLGGISTQTLNEEEKKEFEEWESKISTYKKKYLKNPSLENVLNAHADELYENAADYYNASQATKISDNTATQVIKIAFQCLVKTDEGRTVRSRMTLREITKIINIHSIDEDTVAGVLEIFRLQGNTFLKPYKEEQEALEINSVLDITHESLIRNWARLKEWAKEEYEDFQTYLDFNKQLQRWLANNKSSGYLLPIGPLTYFENWYNTCQPNANWLARYDDREIEHQQKIVDAEENLKQAQHFIKKSANKLFFSRTVLKYGANNILAVAAIFVLICSCTYFYFDYRKKQNDYVINQILEDGIKMLQSKNIDPKTKAEFIINYNRLKSVSRNGFELKNNSFHFTKLLDTIQNDSIAFDVGIQILKICGSYTKGDTLLYDKEQKYSIEVFKYCNKLLEQENLLQLNDLNNKKSTQIKVHKAAWIMSYACLLKFNNVENETIDSINKSIVESRKNLLYEYIINENYAKSNLAKTNLLFEFLSLLAIDVSPDYRKILEVISPFENTTQTQKLLSNIDKKFTDTYTNLDKIPNNGKFELLSILYASEYERNSNAKKYLNCLLDSSMKWHNGTYVPRNITDVLLRFNKSPIEIVDFVNEKTNFYKLKSKDTFWDLKCKDFFLNLSKNQLFEYPQFSKIGYFIPNESKELIWIKNLETIKLSKKENTDKQLSLAKYFKLRGFYCEKYLKSRNSANEFFENALTVFEEMSPIDILNNYNENRFKYGVESTSPFQFLHFYPNDNYEWLSSKGIHSSGSYNEFVSEIEHSIFFDYIERTNRKKMYNTSYGIQCLANFSSYGVDTLTKQVWRELLNIKKTNYKFSKDIETIFLLLEITKEMKQNRFINANNQIKKIKEIGSDKKGFIIEIALLLIEKNKPELAIDLINKIEMNDYENWSAIKAQIYLDLCLRLQQENLTEYTFFLLDKFDSQKLENIQIGKSFFRLTANIGGNNIVKYSNKIFRNVPELFKPEALENFLIGTAESGNYYKAKKFITKDISETKELKLLNLILKVEILKIETKNSFNCKIGKWDDSNFFVYEFGRNNMNNDFKINSIE
jgi:energy-coupling factor transporter ATP-binding protein EcfA2